MVSRQLPTNNISSIIIFSHLKYFLRQYQACCHNHRPTYMHPVPCSYNNNFKVLLEKYVNLIISCWPSNVSSIITLKLVYSFIFNAFRFLRQNITYSCTPYSILLRRPAYNIPVFLPTELAVFHWVRQACSCIFARYSYPCLPQERYNYICNIVHII